jgi:hypothetical protein
MKNIDTLIDDIYGVFDKETTVPPEEARAFGERLGALLSARLGRQDKQYLRLSNLGSSCLRQLWYRVHAPELGEPLSGPARIKFLIGDITEAVVLFLARLAGHDVRDEQHEVELNGVKGHIDAVVDDTLVDVKSASPFSFKKFEAGLTPETDAFGYLTQLGSYGKAKGHKKGAFLAVDKVLGNLTLDKHDLPDIDYERRIEVVRDVLAAPEPPPRAFEDKPDGKSGNRKLGVECSYCSHKDLCWPGLRTFNYGRGPTFLTHVAREPRVDESKSS